MTITVGSLFTGIGGIDLGLERAGMTVVWQSEIDPYACRVLAKHWPDVPNLGDITTIDWSGVERPDLICGGYPCQPFSFAGVRRGEDDPRHLWPHMRNAVRHLGPRWALLENVPGHLSLGFGSVLGDLADLGYDCEWDCIPAAAVGAPHLRYRVFVVAHATGDRRQDRQGLARSPALVGPVPGPDGGSVHGHPAERGARLGVAATAGETDVADADRKLHRHGHDGTGPPVADRTPGDERSGHSLRHADHWATEPDVGRVADGVPHRVDRLRTLGNAVVPQVAEWIGHWIMDAA